MLAAAIHNKKWEEIMTYVKSYSRMKKCKYEVRIGKLITEWEICKEKWKQDV
jgi:hypothetical protein